MRIAPVVCVLFLLSAVALVGATNYPQYTDRYVNDFAGVFSDEQSGYLAALLSALEENSTAQVVVVTVENLSGMAPSQYATELAAAWGVGQASSDNGLLILYARQENKIFAATGYGMEGLLPDSRLGRLLDQFYVPQRDSGNASAGIVAFTEAVALVISGGGGEWSAASGDDFTALAIAGVFVLIVLIVIAAAVAVSLKPRKCKKCGLKMKHVKTEPGPHGSGYDFYVYTCPNGHEERAKKYRSSHAGVIIAGGGFGGGGFGGGGFGGGGFGGGGAGR